MISFFISIISVLLFWLIYIILCSRFMCQQTLKVLKALHLALLCLKQTFIFEDCGVNLVRLVTISLFQYLYQPIPLNGGSFNLFCFVCGRVVYDLNHMNHQDLTSQPRYLITFTVGYSQKANIDAAVKKFSENFTIMLFHYDGRTNDWDEFEWSKRAIHVSVRRQTKWWYAKRFLHPDIVAPYDYIFIWDEDLSVQHFNAEAYIKLVRKHGLEISQPGLEPDKGLTWQMTKRLGDQEVHKVTEERPGWCTDPHLPPCAA
jgi:hypothetical protein